MNKSIAFVGLLSAASLAVGSAYAQDSYADMENPTGFYAGAGWGRFDLRLRQFRDVAPAVNRITEADDNAWKIFAGYRLAPFFALEAAYIDFGSPGDNFEGTGTRGNYRLDLSGFAPYAIGTIPLGPVELFGKVGYYFYDVDLRVDLDSPGPDIDSSHSGSDLLWGGGLGITILERLHARAEYEQVDIENASDSRAIWLSAAWRF